jgi:hypothetical protein
MANSDFKTLEQVVHAFDLTVQTQVMFNDCPTVEPTDFFNRLLDRELEWAKAVGTEKARSEALILPMLLELREQIHHQISVFSGREFNIDADRGLIGYCDFLVSQDPQQLIINAPVVIITEAKKGDLDLGMGQCVAAMVAAQVFNTQHHKLVPAIYGIVSSGTRWRFLRLQQHHLIVDLTDYPIVPTDRLLGILQFITQFPLVTS